MAANQSKITLVDGISGLFCPCCGEPIVDAEEGLFEDLCPHVVFIVDWIGEVSVPASEDEGESDDLRDQVAALADSDSEDDADFLTAAVKLLPESAVVLTFVEPARGGGHDGSEFVLCVDFAAGLE